MEISICQGPTGVQIEPSSQSVSEGATNHLSGKLLCCSLSPSKTIVKQSNIARRAPNVRVDLQRFRVFDNSFAFLFKLTHTLARNIKLASYFFKGRHRLREQPSSKQRDLRRSRAELLRHQPSCRIDEVVA